MFWDHDAHGYIVPTKISAHFAWAIYRRSYDMRPIVAIALTTIRSAIRSHVVKVLLFLLALASIVLPMTIVGDGTAYGQLHITLNYCLGIVGGLLAIVTLWLGCISIGDDVEGYQIHLVLSKPVPRAMYWMGKWFGIVIMQVALLVLAAAAILAIIYWRFHTSNFPEAEMEKLRHEVMVGRRTYDYNEMRGRQFTYTGPEDVERQVREEYQRRVDAGRVVNSPVVSERSARQQIRRKLKGAMAELQPADFRVWTFRGLPEFEKEQFVQLRYRVYVDSAKSKDQRETTGIWALRNPGDDKAIPAPMKVMGGVYHELQIPVRFISPDGELTIQYQNFDPEQVSVIFQLVDGPQLLVPTSSFINNYLRVVVLLILQVMFVAVIGCTAGAGLSIPVAIFLSASYLVLGAAVTAMKPINPEDLVVPSKVLLRGAYYIREAADLLIVSINEFNEVGKLAKGELVEFGQMTAIALKLFLLRGIPIAALGIWALQIKELGLVTKR